MGMNQNQLVRPGHHSNIARAPALAAGDALVLAVNSDVLEQGILAALAEAPGQEPGTSGCVDDGANPDCNLAGLRSRIGKCDAVRVESGLRGEVSLEHAGSTVRSVLQQNLVERRPRHLVRLRTRHLARPREVCVLIRPSVGGRNWHPIS